GVSSSGSMGGSSRLKRLQFLTKNLAHVNGKRGYGTSRPSSLRSADLRGLKAQPGGRPERGGEHRGHRPYGEGSDEEALIGAEHVVDGASREGSEPHADAGDEEDPAVGGAHDGLAEVLPGEDRIERHHPAVRHPEDHRESPERALARGGE